MSILKKKLILLFITLNVCVFSQCLKYEQAYSFIKEDFKKHRIPDYFNSISMSEAYGIMIYEKTLPTKEKENFKNWIDIEKTNFNGLSKDCCLKKLKSKNWKKNWENLKYYSNEDNYELKRFKGPTHIAFFSSIKNDSLRVDVISNSSSGIKYCGDVFSYLFVFDKNNKIKNSTLWLNNYECGGLK